MPKNIFAATRDMLRTALSEMGEHISSRRLNSLARVTVGIWSGDETPDLVKDPTAREAIRRVLANMEEAA